MKYGRYGWSHLLLSWGLGATFLWIGIDIFLHPDAWVGLIPESGVGGLSQDKALQFAAVFDIIIGIALILRLWQRTIATLASIYLAAILFRQGIDQVLVRDVGLLGATLALLAWPSHYKKHLIAKLFRRKKRKKFDEEMEEE